MEDLLCFFLEVNRFVVHDERADRRLTVKSEEWLHIGVYMKLMIKTIDKIYNYINENNYRLLLKE